MPASSYFLKPVGLRRYCRVGLLFLVVWALGASPWAEAQRQLADSFEQLNPLIQKRIAAYAEHCVVIAGELYSLEARSDERQLLPRWKSQFSKDWRHVSAVSGAGFKSPFQVPEAHNFIRIRDRRVFANRATLLSYVLADEIENNRRLTVAGGDVVEVLGDGVLVAFVNEDNEPEIAKLHCDPAGIKVDDDVAFPARRSGSYRYVGKDGESQRADRYEEMPTETDVSSRKAKPKDLFQAILASGRQAFPVVRPKPEILRAPVTRNQRQSNGHLSTVTDSTTTDGIYRWTYAWRWMDLPLTAVK